MAKKLDLTGQIFGQLTAIKQATNKGRYTRWQCQCKCGKIENFLTSELCSGKKIHCSDLKAHPRTELDRYMELHDKIIKKPIIFKINKWKDNIELVQQIGAKFTSALIRKFGIDRNQWVAYALQDKKISKFGMQLRYEAIGEHGEYKFFYQGEEAIMLNGH